MLSLKNGDTGKWSEPVRPGTAATPLAGRSPTLQPQLLRQPLAPPRFGNRHKGGARGWVTGAVRRFAVESSRDVTKRSRPPRARDRPCSCCVRRRAEGDTLAVDASGTSGKSDSGRTASQQ